MDIDFIYHSNLSNFGALVDEEYDAIRGLFSKKIESCLTLITLSLLILIIFYDNVLMIFKNLEM